MTPLVSELVGFVTLANVIGLAIFGLFILLFLRPRGGPEVAFARLLADSRRRTVFLAALCTSLAALFGIGVAETVEWLLGTSALDASVVRTALFGVGAIGVFVLMRDALNTRPMTLEEEWTLKETAARVTSGPPSMSSPIDLPSPEFAADREALRPGR
jgi:hypothetical protein